MAGTVRNPFDRLAAAPTAGQGAETRARVEAAIARAVKFLANRQLHNGGFPNFTWLDPDIDARVPDPSIFPATLIAHSLSFVSGTEPIRQRIADFLLDEVDRRGLWRHWTRESSRHAYPTPDLDDTVCASWALQDIGRPVPDNRKRLLANLDYRGLFRSWVITWDRLLLRPLSLYHFFTVTPSRPDDVDGVVNANVLYYLGDIPETRRVVSYLTEVLRENREGSCDKWYVNLFVIWYFFSRALVGRSPEAGAIILERLGTAGGENALERALALCSRLIWGAEVAEGDIAEILHAQDDAGGWPIAPVYRGNRVRWGSEELVAGFCVEALSRWLHREAKIE